MKLDLTKSKIITRKSNLHVNAVHVDVELWGHIENMSPHNPARLLNFYRKDTNNFVVSPQDSSGFEQVSTEEFSAQIWRVKIVDDWDQLNDVQQIRLYAEIIHSGRMFFVLRLDKP